MDLRQISDDYFVSPQISPADLPGIARAGIVQIICNRPDAEVTADLHATQMAEAAEAAGISFVAIPLTHQTMTPENIARHDAVARAASGPVLAYCASGTRSTIAWALGQAGRIPVDDLLAAAQRGGYDLEGLRPALAAAAQAAKS